MISFLTILVLDKQNRQKWSSTFDSILVLEKRKWNKFFSNLFFNTCARQTEEALSAAVTGSRPIISFTERERPLLPNPSTHLTPTYSFWYPFLVAFNHATNLSNFTPLTNFNQLNISEFFIIQLLFPNESYPLDSLFCSWLPDHPTESDFFMDLWAVGFPRQDKLNWI